MKIEGIVDKRQTELVSIAEKIRSLSYHLTKACNYRCRFCYAHFYKVEKSRLTIGESKRLVDLLYQSGTRKITFAGGEPTLVSFLPDLVIHASNMGMTTVVITNGSKITQEYLNEFDGKLDWLGLSVDSGKENINEKLGRGNGDHVSRTIAIAELAQTNNIVVKLNTVVTSLMWNEDMNWLIERIQPRRWKVFQMLPIGGENDDALDLCVSPTEYNSFIQQHQPSNPIREANEDMMGGYVMIDPEGRFFNNDTGTMLHGPSILDVGVEKAFEFSRFSYDKFLGRGGNYEW